MGWDPGYCLDCDMDCGAPRTIPQDEDELQRIIDRELAKAYEDAGRMAAKWLSDHGIDCYWEAIREPFMRKANDIRQGKQ